MTWLKGLRYWEEMFIVHVVAIRPNDMTWLKGLRFVCGREIPKITGSPNDMTWLKGLRSFLSRSRWTILIISSKRYDLIEGIKIHICRLLQTLSLPSKRYDLIEGIKIYSKGIIRKNGACCPNDMTWLKGLRWYTFSCEYLLFSLYRPNDMTWLKGLRSKPSVSIHTWIPCVQTIWPDWRD